MRELSGKRLLGARRGYGGLSGIVVFRTTGENTAELTVGPAPFSVAVSEPAAFSGTYVVNPALLYGGPFALREPAIWGTAQVGQELGVTPGLWTYLASGGSPTVSWQWQRDDVDIDGATQDRLTPEPSDAGSMLRIVETATDSGGTRVSISKPVSIGA